MGNLRPDTDYFMQLLTKPCAFLSFNNCQTVQVIEDYYNEMNEKYTDGKMDTDDFKKVFRIAFPERPEEKLDKLIEQLKNPEGKICKREETETISY